MSLWLLRVGRLEDLWKVRHIVRLFKRSVDCMLDLGKLELLLLLVHVALAHNVKVVEHQFVCLLVKTSRWCSNHLLLVWTVYLVVSYLLFNVVVAELHIVWLKRRIITIGLETEHEVFFWCIK